MTAYEDVYDSFRTKVSDYDLINFTNFEENEILYSFLKISISKFGRLCNKLSDRDDDLSQFNIDLTDEEIDILSELMLEVWVQKKLHNSDLLRNNLSTKDFSFFSNKNIIDQLRGLYKESKRSARSMMNQYSILHSDYKTMR